LANLELLGEIQPNLWPILLMQEDLDRVLINEQTILRRLDETPQTAGDESVYVALIVSGGNLPGRRAGTKPQPISFAIAAPRMNPRASAPSTRSGFFSAPHVESCSTVYASAAGSARSGVMSLKPTPGCGQSGISRTFSARFT
jgi:hypothetical protein